MLEYNRTIKARSKIIKISTVGIAGKIVYANDAFLNIHKITKNDVIGTKLSRLLCSDMPDEYYSDIMNNLKKGAVWHGILPTTSSDGVSVWSRGTAYPLYDYSGNIAEYRFEGILCSRDEIIKYKKTIMEKYEKGEL